MFPGGLDNKGIVLTVGNGGRGKLGGRTMGVKGDAEKRGAMPAGAEPRTPGGTN